jgi:CRP-like cAMP-binding protein
MQEILLLLTPSLKGQLTMFLYRDAILRIPFLQGRDPQFYLLFLDKLEPVKFQRETVMLKKGTVAQRLYFIVKGRVLNTTFNRIYSDGAVIGETDIIYRTKRRDSF